MHRAGTPTSPRPLRCLVWFTLIGLMCACASAEPMDAEGTLDPGGDAMPDTDWGDMPDPGSGPRPPARPSGGAEEPIAGDEDAFHIDTPGDAGEPGSPQAPVPPPENMDDDPEAMDDAPEAPPPEEGNSGGGAIPPPPAPPPPPVVCTPIIEGLSTVFVDGVPRLFNVQFPADRSHMALLFLWHGFLEIPTTFAGEVVYDPPAGRWRPFNPNAFPMPLMIVTPFDLKILPPFGLDWDIVAGGTDVRYFDAMMQCIHEQFSIEDTRIYSFGFSAGAVFSNLLAAIRPHFFAATISESGAWFNDPGQVREVLIQIIQWQWPAFNPADGGNILLTHGGPRDFATIISLEAATQSALPFLYNAGRTVTECQHDFGHTRAPDLTEAMYYEWMWSHWRGGPPRGDLPPSFPVWPDRIIGSTFCTFHPAP